MEMKRFAAFGAAVLIAGAAAAGAHVFRKGIDASAHASPETVLGLGVNDGVVPRPLFEPLQFFSLVRENLFLLAVKPFFVLRFPDFLVNPFELRLCIFIYRIHWFFLLSSG